MLQLEHVNLVITNLEKSLAFYRAALPHWRVRDRGEGDWNGKPRTWLHLGDDYQYIAMSDHGEGPNRDLEGHQTGFAHFAFVTNNLQALIDRMAKAGYQPSKPGSDNSYRDNIYYEDPDGFEVEFVQYHSDQPIERNSTQN